jgi:hypothetical protein
MAMILAEEGHFVPNRLPAVRDVVSRIPDLGELGPLSTTTFFMAILVFRRLSNTAAES